MYNIINNKDVCSSLTWHRFRIGINYCHMVVGVDVWSWRLIFILLCICRREKGVLHWGVATLRLCYFEVVLLWDCVTLRLCYFDVVLHWDVATLRLCYIEVVLRVLLWGCVTLMLCYFEVLLHWCCVTLMLCYIEVVLHWGCVTLRLCYFEVGMVKVFVVTMRLC